jgi:hypothetical protein
MSQLDDLEAALLSDPLVRSEVEKLRPTLQRMSLGSFAALSIAVRRETDRRVKSTPRPVGIGNR